MPNGTLTGLKVVECSTWAFGPLAGSMLGDLGGDVVKVESPNSPDAARRLVRVASVDVEMPHQRFPTAQAQPIAPLAASSAISSSVLPSRSRRISAVCWPSPGPCRRWPRASPRD